MAQNAYIGEDVYLSDLSVQDKPWDYHRAIADKIATLYEQSELSRYSERITDCSKLLEFGASINSDSGEIGYKLLTARFCRVRHCSICQWRRTMKWQAKAFSALPKVAQAYPKHRWIFLTLTVRNCPIDELRETLDMMNKSFGRMTKLASFPATGWIKSVEVTRAYDCYHNGKYLGRHGKTWIDDCDFDVDSVPTDECHPHLHCLLLVPASYFGRKYLSHDDWTQMWKRSLRVDYQPIVNIKAVKSKDDKGKGISDIGAVLETLKYSVKSEDLAVDSEWLAKLTTQLNKTRAVAVGGCLREFLRDESDDDDLININDDKEDSTPTDYSLWFAWFKAMQRYKKTSRD